MRLKSFHASSVTEAMKMIRESLGEDAIIVSTVEEPTGGVSVTAAVDSPASGHQFFNYDRDATEDDSGWLQYDAEQDISAVAEDLTDLLIKHAVPEDIIDQIVSCAGIVGLEQTHIALVAALEHIFSYRPLSDMPTGRPMILVGPPGAGKTLAVAKIAARVALSGKKPAVITTDTLRAGGTEQLAAFTRIMNVQLYKAKTGIELRTLIDSVSSADQILIDSSGLNPFRSDDMRALARLIAVADMEPLLVLPSGYDAEECGEMARIYAALGVRYLMPTRLDIGRRLGGLLAAAHHGGMIFTDASDTPQVADGLLPLSPDKLAHLLMPQAAPAYTESESLPS
jgi:flagellar biosynthesis protein FlhF